MKAKYHPAKIEIDDEKENGQRWIKSLFDKALEFHENTIDYHTSRKN